MSWIIGLLCFGNTTHSTGSRYTLVLLPKLVLHFQTLKQHGNIMLVDMSAVFTVCYTVAAQFTKHVLHPLTCLKYCDIRQGDADCNRDCIRILLCIMTLHIGTLKQAALTATLFQSQGCLLFAYCSSSTSNSSPSGSNYKSVMFLALTKSNIWNCDISHVSEPLTLAQLLYQSIRVYLKTIGWWRG